MQNESWKYNTANVTNKLKIAGTNDYPNGKRKAIVYFILYIKWMKNIKLKTKPKVLEKNLGDYL